MDELREAMREACDLLAERKYGSAARSPGHNARLVLEAALRDERGSGPDGPSGLASTQLSRQSAPSSAALTEGE